MSTSAPFPLSAPPFPLPTSADSIAVETVDAEDELDMGIWSTAPDIVTITLPGWLSLSLPASVEMIVTSEDSAAFADARFFGVDVDSGLLSPTIGDPFNLVNVLFPPLLLMATMLLLPLVISGARSEAIRACTMAWWSTWLGCCLCCCCWRDRPCCSWFACCVAAAAEVEVGGTMTWFWSDTWEW